MDNDNIMKWLYIYEAIKEAQKRKEKESKDNGTKIIRDKPNNGSNSQSSRQLQKTDSK